MTVYTAIDDSGGIEHVAAEVDGLRYRRAGRDGGADVWTCEEWIGIGPLTWRLAQHWMWAEADAVQWVAGV